MIKTELGGIFGLDEIKRVTRKLSRLNSFYEIRFCNDKRKFSAYKYHAFLTEELVSKSVFELQPGDKIWIDISAFKSDGTLR